MRCSLKTDQCTYNEYSAVYAGALSCFIHHKNKLRINHTLMNISTNASYKSYILELDSQAEVLLENSWTR
jgi:hypothetical protein